MAFEETIEIHVRILEKGQMPDEDTYIDFIKLVILREINSTQEISEILNLRSSYIRLLNYQQRKLQVRTHHFLKKIQLPNRNTIEEQRLTNPTTYYRIVETSSSPRLIETSNRNRALALQAKGIKINLTSRQANSR